MFLFSKLCPTALWAHGLQWHEKFTWSTASHQRQFEGSMWCEVFAGHMAGNGRSHSLMAKPVWVSHASCNLPFLWENPEVTQKDKTGEFWDTQTNLESRGPRWRVWEIRWEGWLYRPRVLAGEQKWISQRARKRVSILQCYKTVGFSLKNSSTVDPYASFDSHSPTTSVKGNPLLLLVQVKNLRHYLELKYPQPLGLNL